MGLTHKSKSIAHNFRYETKDVDPVLRAFVEDSELFGNRWAFSYTSGVLITASQVVVMMPSGKTEAYSLGGGATGELTPVNDDAYDRLYRDSDQFYRLVKRNGETMEYGFAQAVNKLYLTQYTDINGDSLIFGYNTSGLLDTISDALGRVTTFSYTTVGNKVVDGQTVPVQRVSTVSDPFGRVALFGYDASLNLTEITDMGNYKSTLSYDTNLNITSITRPQFGTWLFKVDPLTRGPRTGDEIVNIGYLYPDIGVDERVVITDPNGNTIEYYYRTKDKQTWVVKPNHYAEFNNRFGDTASSILSPKKIYEVKRSTYGWSRITSITDEEGNQDKRTYYSTGLLRSEEYQNGRLDFYEYNEANQLIAKIVGKGTEIVKRYEYEYLDSDSQLITRETGPSVIFGQRTQHIMEYDSKKNVTKSTRHGFRADKTGAVNSISRQENYTYNDRNQTLTINGPRTDLGDVTEYGYYDCLDLIKYNCGKMQSITNALGHITIFDEYSVAGLLKKMTNANGLITEFTYDDLHRVIRIKQYPSGEVMSSRTTNMSYQGAKNKLASVEASNGLILTYEYDLSERLVVVADSLGNRLSYSYDKNNNLITADTFGVNDSHEELQQKIENTYNHMDFITAVNNSGSISRATYDGYGNELTMLDPNQNPEIGYQYDELYRITQFRDSVGNNLAYAYNVKDKLVQLKTDNNAITNFQYNDFDEVTQEESPDRGIINYQHDSAGNVIQMTDGRGVTSIYSYDALNRVVTVSYPNASENITYGYDSCTNGIGRLCQVLDPSGTTSFAYDVFGNITIHTKVELGNTYITSYTYDSADQIESVTYPTGLTLNYQRDQRNRITNITLDHSSLSGTEIILSGIQYRADDLLLRMTHGGGLEELRDYDLRGRLFTQQLGSLLNKTYSYDANGNILGIDTLNIDLGYQYDALDRIASESGVSTAAFSYDENSNRLSQILNGAMTNYSHIANSNRLTQVGATIYTLDASGNTLTDGIKQFAYNDRNRMETYSESGDLIASYQYNFVGSRTQKVVSGNSHQYHYDLQGRRIQHDSNNLVNSATIWLGTQAVAHIQFDSSGSISNITHLIGNQVGSPILGINATQQVVWRWESDAFGTSQPITDPDGDSINIIIENRYPGQYFDSESLLHYNWNRYYDAKVGRYISSDPIGINGGSNTYSYVSNNPLTYLDYQGTNQNILNLLDGLQEALDFANGSTITGPELGEPTIGNSGLAHGWRYVHWCKRRAECNPLPPAPPGPPNICLANPPARPPADNSKCFCLEWSPWELVGPRD